MRVAHLDNGFTVALKLPRVWNILLALCNGSARGMFFNYFVSNYYLSNNIINKLPILFYSGTVHQFEEWKNDRVNKKKLKQSC